MACIAPALAARGHEVHVLSCAKGQQYGNYTDSGVYVHRRGQLRVRGLSRLSQILKLQKTTIRFEKGLWTFFEYRQLSIDFDVIEYPDWLAEGWLFALFCVKPLVAQLHGPLILISKYDGLPMSRDILWASALERFAIRYADEIISPSRLLVRLAKDIGWLKDVEAEVIPHPIDWARWCDTEPVDTTKPIVLFLGRLQQCKAPELLVKAISLIRREIPEAKALFVGSIDGQRDGLPYVEWLKKHTSDTSGCEFVGPVSRHELPAILSKSRVLAVPSWFDSYSMVALEAMAAGRPVVVTETSGVSEFVSATKTGRIVPAGDYKALANALLPFLKDATYTLEEGEKARCAVQEILNPVTIAAQREKVYEQAMASFESRVWANFLGFPYAKLRRMTKFSSRQN